MTDRLGEGLTGLTESVEFAWERQFNVERAFVQCPTCDGEGDVLHDIDCDGCARGEDHSEPCPRCNGETVVPALIPNAASRREEQ